MIRMVRIVFRLHRVREVVEAFLTTPSIVLSLFFHGIYVPLLFMHVWGLFSLLLGNEFVILLKAFRFVFL